MSDVVATVPKGKWAEWLAEGDLPGEVYSLNWSYFRVPTQPEIVKGERVYVVAHGRLRGYAPLVKVASHFAGERGIFLVRAGLAVAVTIPTPIRGFQGWRYRWWERETEQAFPEWQRP